MPEHRVADLADVVAGPDHGHRRGRQQARDRPGLAALLPLVGDGEGVLGLLDREGQVDDAVLVGALGLVAGVLEDPHHRAVLRQHLGDEAPDAALAGGRGEVLEQDRAQAAALVGVLDQEGDLGVVGAGVPVVAADADDLVPEQDHERHPLVVVDVGEPVQVLVGEPLHRPEEPVVAGLVAAALHQAGQPVGVLGADGPQVHRAAVGGDDVGLPARRLCGVLLLRGAGRLSHGGRPGRGRSRGSWPAGCA